MALGSVLIGGVRPAAAEEGTNHLAVLAYDRGLEGADTVRVTPSSLHELPVELLIEFFTQCDAGESLQQCGPPHAQWVAPDVPVRFCTFHRNRPPDHISRSLLLHLCHKSELENCSGYGWRCCGDGIIFHGGAVTME